jgi:UDP-N-acetylmuramoyl-tripeptide--D-alanyl-D-alanine ligase
MRSNRLTPPLWTSRELGEATGGTFSVRFDAAGVSIDTRTLTGGDLFIALVGEGRDGHAFVADALAKGAAGAMVHTPVSPGQPAIQVDDTLTALARLGGFARARFGESDAAAKLVAVTGSVGKTTTKEMLRSILSRFGRTHAAVASYNNHWGLPLTLARTPLDAEFCVAEIGMNHPGEIAPLARLAQPHVAVITSVEKAHIGFLGSIEAIADEKAAILRGLEPGGVAVLPAGSPLFPRLRAAASGRRIVTFGTTAWADVRLVDLVADADGSDVRVRIAGQPIQFRLNAPGRHMAINALAAIAGAVHLAGMPAEVYGGMARALETFAPVTGRGVRRPIAVPGGTALLLDESYNGNPASMRAALDVLRLQPATRRLAVLGDMLELGDAGPAEHRALAAAVAESADCLFACGPLMQDLFATVPASQRGVHAQDSAALAPILTRSVRPGDAILIKGSLGSRMKLVVNALEAHAEAA